MIRIANVSLPLSYTAAELKKTVAKKLRIEPERLTGIVLVRKSVDARKKRDIRFVLTVDAEIQGNEDKWIAKLRDSHVTKAPDRNYTMPKAGKLPQRPVVVGFGPGGMFAALLLARAGLRPIVLERGECVENRQQTVNAFWNGGALRTQSNVQFGEGGAGTFSDGKLNTGIKDERIYFVLKTLVEHGAPEQILYDAKPHVGTDRLPQTVRGIREEILSLGGEVRFLTQMTDLTIQNGRLKGVTAVCDGIEENIETEHLILSIGHSARDTFQMLYDKGEIPMEAKPFSVGARIEHLAARIDRAQYGDFAGNKHLGAADYKLNAHVETGRGVYTFCMCPGGTVVGAASEERAVVTNGMSAFARDGQNSNAAVLVGVEPKDYGSDHPLSGVAFQRKIEQAAFLSGGASYCAPCQRLEDLRLGRVTTAFGEVLPTYHPGVAQADLRTCLPDFVVDSMLLGLTKMGQQLPGFDHPDALLTAPETRSSSPVRILRNENRMSPTVQGLFPCGEGAGYAGGITSAAVDGMRCAEAVLFDSLQTR